MRKVNILENTSWANILTSESDVEKYFRDAKDGSKLTFDWETTGLEFDATPLLMSLHIHGDSHPAIIPIDFYFSDGLPMGVVARLANKWFPKFKLVAHNAKYDTMISVVNGISDTVLEIFADTLIMIHLYNPDLEKKLETRVRLDFGVSKKTFEEWITPEDAKRKRKWTDIDWSVEADELEDILAGYSAEDAWWETKMYEKYSPLLTPEERAIHDKIEIPFISILRDAKIRGVLINKELLEDLASKAREEEAILLQKVYDHCGCIFNLNSSKQKQEVFFDKLKYPVIYTTKSGKPSTDSKTFLEWANRGLQVGNDLKEYSVLHKLLTGYLEPIPLMLDEHNVLRGDLNSCGTKTGRCIEEHQHVMTVGGLKQIRDMKVGDLVYCYDNEGKLHIRKVLNVFRQGRKKLVRVKYQSTGDMKEGYLLCTPDHLLKTKKRGWVQAKDLHREKVYHLRRSNKYQELGHTRPRLYGTNGFMMLEQQVIKKEYFGEKSYRVIHHIDGDTTNNSIDNLRVLTNAQHARLHLNERIVNGTFVPYDPTGTHHFVPSGKDNPHWINLSKLKLLRMLIQAEGRPTYVPMDFDTYKRKCQLEGINLAEVEKRFSKGSYISRGDLVRLEDFSGRKQQKKLGVGYYRLNELKEYYGVTNHLILSVKHYGEGECYDIEVEDYNNFICEELCVHNCSSAGPNLQNQPNNPNYPVRQAFIPRPGYVLVNYDYSQLELRMLAHLSGDKNYVQVFLNNEDPHGDVAKRLGITRKKAKTVNFGISYGMSKVGLAASLKISEEEAESIISSYYKTYSGYAAWEKRLQDKACRVGYTENIFGRRRYFPELTKDPFHRDRKTFYAQLRDVVNTTVQGSGADVMKRATVETVRRIKEEGIDAHFLIQVHDENLFEAKSGADAMRCEQIMIECMQETTKLRVPLIADGKILANWHEMHNESLASLPYRIDTGILLSIL